jgi:hypothetical protein
MDFMPLAKPLVVGLLWLAEAKETERHRARRFHAHAADYNVAGEGRRSLLPFGWLKFLSQTVRV